MTEELPDRSDREIEQMVTAQSLVMDHHEEVKAEYKRKIIELGEIYVDVSHADSKGVQV